MKVLVAGATIGKGGQDAANELSAAGAFVCLAGDSSSTDQLKQIQTSLPNNHRSDIIVVDTNGAKELADMVLDRLFNVVVMTSSSREWLWPSVIQHHIHNGDIDTLFEAIEANYEEHQLIFSVMASKSKGHYFMVDGESIVWIWELLES